MKISIVTISYNQAEFLERAINSVIEQDYDSLEYIVVDPGSTDGSREIIKQYSSKIHKIVFEPDTGPADGLNKGFSNATGDIFGFLNSDDILLPGTISHIISFFFSNPSVDVVSGHAIIIDQYDRKLRLSYSDPFSLIGYAYGAVVLMQPSTFFRSAMFRKTTGFNKSNTTNWDGELFIDMCEKGAHFALVNKFLSCYRLHPGSITFSTKLDKDIKDYHKIKFKKIMGRNKYPLDMIFQALLKILKYTKNPNALIQRLLNGTVYGRRLKG